MKVHDANWGAGMLKLPPLRRMPRPSPTAVVRSGYKTITIDLPEIIKQPFVYNCGVGTDSIGGIVILGAMHALGVDDAKPDRIMFADTGDEKRDTYDYIPVLNAYLDKIGFPLLTVVHKQSKHKSLADSCLNLMTMPSPAYGGKSCSLKWKVDAMDKSHNHWHMAQAAWHVGMPVRKLIGYDSSPADCRRSKNLGDEWYEFVYPLRDAGIRREQLLEIILRAGLPDPGKSACYMCPASKKPELLALYESEPDKLATALLMEAYAMLKTATKFLAMPAPKDDWSTEGMGRTFAWREFLHKDHPEILATLRKSYDLGDEAWEAYLPLRDERNNRRALRKAS